MEYNNLGQIKYDQLGRPKSVLLIRVSADTSTVISLSHFTMLL